jgi:hypothetical protein
MFLGYIRKYFGGPQKTNLNAECGSRAACFFFSPELQERRSSTVFPLLLIITSLDWRKLILGRHFANAKNTLQCVPTFLWLEGKVMDK